MKELIPNTDPRYTPDTIEVFAKWIDCGEEWSQADREAMIERFVDKYYQKGLSDALASLPEERKGWSLKPDEPKDHAAINELRGFNSAITQARENITNLKEKE